MNDDLFVRQIADTFNQDKSTPFVAWTWVYIYIYIYIYIYVYIYTLDSENNWP